MPYGVTATGFVKKPLSVIKTELEDDYKAAFGAGIDVSSRSVFGQIIGIHADREAQQWEVQEAVYNAQDPDAAGDNALDIIAALTGVKRNAASFSTAPGEVNVDDGFEAAAGEIIVQRESDPSNRWTNQSAVSNTSGSADDVTVVWVAIEPGPVFAAEEELVVLETELTGLNTATNTADASLGEPIETNAELRLRREQSLGASGSASVPGIRAALIGDDNVAEAKVFTNRTDETAGGLPPHSVEAVILPTEDDAFDSADFRNYIAGILLANVAAGIETVGTLSGDADNGAGGTETLLFNPVTEVDLYVDFGLDTDPDTYAGDAAVAAAAATYIQQNQGIGDDVIRAGLICAALDVDGVLDVTFLAIDDSSSPSTEANFATASRQLARLATDDVTFDGGGG